MTVGERVPTLGDLCDVDLLVKNNDPFAMARLLKRWLDPEPSLEALRDMTMFDLQQYFAQIVAKVQEQALVLTADVGKTRH